MRRALCALVLIALSAVACSGQPSAAPSPTSGDSAAATSEQAGRPAPEPPPILPLTGEKIDRPAPARPVLALKIDNAPAAAPQQGLDVGDIVFEEEVEGGITRFIALYHSQDPGDVGPVRSGREVDVLLLPAFKPVFGISGAAEPVDALFARAGLLVVEDEEDGEAAGAFHRVADRAAPHNLFVRAAPLWEAGKDRAAPRRPVWAFDGDAPHGGRRVESVSLVFSPFTAVRWSWSEGVWRREQNGAPHETVDGQQLTADNVAVMRVARSQGNRKDSSGNPTVDLDVIGSGEAVVLRDGRALPARWEKKHPTDQITWTDRRGRPLPLTPGRTWVELLATDARLTLDAAGSR